MTVDVVMTQRTMFALTDFSCHPERSEAESNFFVPDPKRRCAPFAPHCVRSSTTLRMTRTKKRRAKQGGIYEQSAHIYSSIKAIGRFVHLAKSDSGKFLVSLFSKSERGQEGQSPRKTALFFLRSFFFCASCVKRKSDRMTVNVVMTQRTMCATSL